MLLVILVENENILWLKMELSERTVEGHQLFRPSSEENTVKVASQCDAKAPDPRLLDGMPLPKYLIEKFPRHLLGMPIVEIDPFYHDQKVNLVFRFVD